MVWRPATDLSKPAARARLAQPLRKTDIPGVVLPDFSSTFPRQVYFLASRDESIPPFITCQSTLSRRNVFSLATLKLFWLFVNMIRCLRDEGEAL